MTPRNMFMGIMGSVGKGGRNNLQDVKTVQTLLNERIKIPTPQLKVDGKCGRKTKEAITEFQKNSVGIMRPDGRVDPAGRTLTALNDPSNILNYTPAPPNAPPPPGEQPDVPSTPKPNSPHSPVLLSQSQVADLNFVTDANWDIGLIGKVEAGKIFLGFDGSRMVYEVMQGAVVFLIVKGKPDKVGKFYAQTKVGFIDETERYVLSNAGKSAAGMVKLAEFEANLFKAMAAATGAPGFLLVTGVDALQFWVVHQKEIGLYKEAFIACLHVRRILKTYAPTLYEKIIEQVLFQFKDKVMQNIPESAARNPKIVAGFLGGLIGKIGMSAAKGKFTALGTVFAILSNVAAAAVKSAPGAGKITFDKEVSKITAEMRKAGVNISPGESEQIVKEVEKNPKQIEQALNLLNQAFSKIK